jgi:hypothetical protein
MCGPAAHANRDHRATASMSAPLARNLALARRIAERHPDYFDDLARKWRKQGQLRN